MAKKSSKKNGKEDSGGEVKRLREEMATLKKKLEDLGAEKERIEQHCAELETGTSLVDGLRRNLGVLVGKMDLLARFASEINAFDLEKISDAAVEKVPRLFGANRASLYLYDREPAGDRRGVLGLVSQNGTRDLDAEINLRKRPDTLMAEAARKKSVLLVEDIVEYELERGIKFLHPDGSDYPNKSCIIIPLLTRNRLIGILNLCDREDGKAFDPFHDLPVAKQVADMLATSIENYVMFRELQERTRVDGLTNLLNHNTFYFELEKEVLRSRRYERSLSLVVFDLDHFKKFNDVYGHQAGDYILMEIAQIVRESIRAMDIPSRYGGDEFCVILPETEIAGAAAAAKRLTEATCKHSFRYDGKFFDIRLSVGIADLLPDESANDLVRRADEACLAAKRMGRNRIVDAAGQVIEIKDGE
ncbi:MAG: sensor domain-containing diguanylate cyclase [Planctomycetota bacterium]|jgi:diguanylate cyclase (GGDEF)-like protein